MSNQDLKKKQSMNDDNNDEEKDAEENKTGEGNPKMNQEERITMKEGEEQVSDDLKTTDDNRDMNNHVDTMQRHDKRKTKIVILQEKNLGILVDEIPPNLRPNIHYTVHHPNKRTENARDSD